ncbi:MAG: hypothetical protein FWD95_04120 [Nocardioidaceae bacterium]|nr:hypothetical protein [Nocardioidaceae bacterium]
MNVHYYSAPKGYEPDPFVDPVPMPTPSMRLITPPSYKTEHVLAAALCRALNLTRTEFTKALSLDRLYTHATAWALAHHIEDIYVAHSEDLTRDGVLLLLDYATTIGAQLHLVFAHAQAVTHTPLLLKFGAQHQDWNQLPDALRQPPPTTDTEAPKADPLDNIELPADHWPTFRAAYHDALNPDQVAILDHIYLDAYATARASKAHTRDTIETLGGHLWNQHGIHPVAQTVTNKALQAALFRNGYNIKLDLTHWTRRLHQHHVNVLTPSHYKALATYADPWRSAATVLHAHHLPTETLATLTCGDTNANGQLPQLQLIPEAAVIVAAQRWNRLTTGDPTTPLFDTDLITIRRGIRAVVAELNLPIQTYWRIEGPKNSAKPSVTIERITT